MIVGVRFRLWSAELETKDWTFIRLEGDWELKTEDGQTIDRSVDVEEREDFELWRTCGSKLTRVSVSEAEPAVLQVDFDNGLRLRAWANGPAGWEIGTGEAAIFSDPDLHISRNL